MKMRIQERNLKGTQASPKRRANNQASFKADGRGGGGGGGGVPKKTKKKKSPPE